VPFCTRVLDVHREIYAQRGLASIALTFMLTACGGARPGLATPDCAPASAVAATAPLGTDEAKPPPAPVPHQAGGDSPLLRVVRQVGHADKMFGVRFSSNGKYVATGSGDRSLKVWDVASGRLLLSDDRNDDQVTAFDLLPDRPAALVGTRTGTLTLLNLESGERRTLEAKSDFMSAVRVSPDGKRAIGGARGRPKLWDLTAGTVLAQLDTKGHPIDASAFGPHGPMIAIAEYQSLRVLGLEGGKTLFELREPKGRAIGGVAFSRDGRRLIVGRITPYEIDVFDTDKFTKLITLPGQHYEIHDAAISPDGRVLASCGRDATLNFWDLQTGSLLRKVPFHDSLTSVDYAPDGRSVIVGAGERLYQPSRGVIVDSETGAILRELTGAEQVTVAAGLSADGQRAMTASNGEAVTFWDLRTFARESTATMGDLANVRGATGFTLHDLRGAAISADGTVVAAAGGGASFIHSDITGYTLVRVLDTAHGSSKLLKTEAAGRIDDMALSPDGSKVAVAQWNGYQLSTGDLWVWDVESERIIQHLHRSIRGDGVAVARALFTHDSKRIFWGGDEDFALLDLESGTARAFSAPSAVRSIALTSDGRFVATSGEGVQIWDVTTGQKRALGEAKAWHGTSPITWLDNGAHLLSTDGFSKLDVWDVAENKVIRSIPIAAGGMRSLASSGDGKRVIASSTDGTARVFDLTSGASVQLLTEHGEWLTIDDEGYFDASRNGGDLVNLVSGLEPYRIDQVAARNNRPDRLLERMHAGDPDLIATFYARHVRRLERLGFSESDLERPFAGAPHVALSDGALRGRHAAFNAQLTSSTPLKSYQVYVNQVPTLGSRGAPVSGTSSAVQVDVPLTFGNNRVEVSATSTNGVESLRATQSFKLPQRAPRKLYFLAFGVSHYQNSAYNLGYAHKDALDLTEVVRQMAGKVYTSVVARAFIDGEVTRDTFKQAKALLRDATPDDALVVFIAGHGGYSRDAAAEYFFLTHEADAKRLRETAAPFELVEDLLRDVQPRQKLLLVDTCDSGDRDPGAPELASATPTAASRGVRSRAVRALTLDLAPSTPRATRRNFLFDRDRYIFNDLVRRTGAIVFSSSRGSELSYETPEAQNGLFTEEILRALTSSVADANHDGIVDDRELRTHVARAVAQQSGEQQHPVVDTDNPDVRIELPIVLDALPILTRGDPLASGSTASRGLSLSASAELSAHGDLGLGTAPCPLPQGCGCHVASTRDSNGLDAPSVLGALLVSAWFLRRRRRPGGQRVTASVRLPNSSSAALALGARL
jgi:WD40 repeat protein